MPAEQGGSSAVGSLSMGDLDPTVLRALPAAGPEPAIAVPTATVEEVLQPVAPPAALPLIEMVPAKPEVSRSAKPKPRTERKQREARKSRHARRVRADNSGGGGQIGERAGAGDGRKKGSARAGAAGSDRAATPVPGNPRPRYPRIARSRGQEGRVLIRVSVLGNGRVGSAAVTRSSGHGALDQAALKAVKRWRFTPALRSGKPVTATLTVPVVFRLEG